MILSPKKKQQIYTPYIRALQSARKENDLSQAALAEAVGLSSKYVTLIESHKRVPSLDCLLALLAQSGVQRSLAHNLVEEIMDRFEWLAQ